MAVSLTWTTAMKRKVLGGGSEDEDVGDAKLGAAAPGLRGRRRRWR